MAQPTIPEIETERLVLRGPTADDVDTWARFLEHPEDFRYMPWLKTDETPQERARRLVDAHAASWDTPTLTAMGWMIARKDDDTLVGMGRLEQIEDTTDAEIEYRIGRTFWGQGFAGEAARAITRFGFEHSGWGRILAYVVAENTASVRLVESLGMTFEKEVNYLELMGGATDIEMSSPFTQLYALTRDEFRHGEASYRVR